MSTKQLDLLPINTTVFYAFPVSGRQCGKVVGYNQRKADIAHPPEKFPYIVQWDDGVRDIVSPRAISMRPVLSFKGRIR